MTPSDDLERRLRAPASPGGDTGGPPIAEAAAAAGLLDVAYARYDSPLGRCCSRPRRPDWSGWPTWTSMTRRRSWPTSRPTSRRVCSRRRVRWTRRAASSRSTSRGDGASSASRWTGA